MNHVWLAIIAGGQGTRLFPISHADRPKQFCQLDKDNTFIQSVVKNFTSIGIKSTHIVVITTNDSQAQLAREQLLSRGILSQNILEISAAFGYAGAMFKAAEFIHKLDSNAIIINTPSDQYVAVNGDFEEAVATAVGEARFGSPVIIGVKVNDLVTATGCGHALYDESSLKCFAVKGFIEKPDKKQADEIMRRGNSACNTGINVWRADTLLQAINRRSAKGLKTDDLMRKLGNLKIAVGTFEWHDCGTLKSLYEISKKTPNHKNANLGDGTFERVSCRRSLLYAEAGMELRVAGAEDDAVVFTVIDGKPIVVIAKLEESQRIKALAEDYKLHETFLTDDFSFGARNNIVLRSNVSDDLIAGFVGVKNYAVYVSRNPDGSMSAIVSQQLTAN